MRPIAHTPMRKILVLGATGGTGRQIVSQAAQQGYEVTVLVRNSQRASGIADSARVLAADVLDGGQALDEVMPGQDAVISALGVGNSLRSSGLTAASVPAIVGAMERHGVRRLIFTSAYGVGETRAQVPILPRLLMGVLLRDIYADKAAGDAELRRSSLDWTLVYPVTLTDGPATGRYRAGERLELHGMPRVSRADVAHFLLTQLGDRTYVRKGVLVSS